jgi:Dehydrogenases with different specificities (related to short-chain alcohol dehydrogenases)
VVKKNKSLWPSSRRNLNTYCWRGESGDEILKNFFIKETPIRMVGLPEHMADAILFLCASNYITGADINVDGGRLADGSMGSHAG